MELKIFWCCVRDGITGIKEAITATFPASCSVNQVPNMLCYVVAEKDKKAFATDLKTIRFTTSPSEQAGFERMEAISEKGKDKYPHAMKSRAVNWNVICSIFKFSMDVHKVVHTTNVIESLNSTYRCLNSQRSAFLSDIALLKATIRYHQKMDDAAQKLEQSPR